MAGSLETLEKECHKQLNLGPSGCACIAARAEELLNENQQALVAAMVTKDQVASDDRRANFMMSALQIYAAQ